MTKSMGPVAKPREFVVLVMHEGFGRRGERETCCENCGKQGKWEHKTPHRKDA
jgi:hypothetical protein